MWLPPQPMRTRSMVIGQTAEGRMEAAYLKQASRPNWLESLTPEVDSGLHRRTNLRERGVAPPGMSSPSPGLTAGRSTLLNGAVTSPPPPKGCQEDLTLFFSSAQSGGPCSAGEGNRLSRLADNE